MRWSVVIGVVLLAGCQSPFGKGFVSPASSVGAAEGEGDERDEASATKPKPAVTRNAQTIVVTVPGARPN